MSLRNHGVMLVSCLALAGGVGCAAVPPPNPTAAKVQTGLVFHAKASSTTTKIVGITHWHSIIEKGTGGVVMDGSDAKGKVRVITAMRVGSKAQILHLDMYAPSKGTIAVDLKTGQVLESSLSKDDLAQFATLMQYDWTAHDAQTAYSALTYVVAANTVASGAAAVIGGVVATVTSGKAVGGLAAVALGVASVVDAYDNGGARARSGKSQQAKDADDAALREQLEKLQTSIRELNENTPKSPSDPLLMMPMNMQPSRPAGPAAGASADPAAQNDPAANANAQDQSADPGLTDTTTQETNLPPADSGNLDDVPSQDPSATPVAAPEGNGETEGNTGDVDTGGIDTGGNDTGGNDTGGNDTGGGDQGSNDTGGNDTGGGDQGSDQTAGDPSGGDESGGAEASGTCRKAAISKTTKMRACTHY